MRIPSTIVATVVATMVLLATYLATSAPDLTFWDASEFITAAHTLGIPHPPGTPLWVLMGKISTLVFSGTSPARMVTLLAVWCAALAGGAGAWLMAQWLGARAGVVAAVMAGTMYSVWNLATEAEVYAAALLLAVMMLVVGEWSGRTSATVDQRDRGRMLLAFLAGLAVPLHLSALVALPGAVALAWAGHAPSRRQIGEWLVSAIGGASAVLVLMFLSGQDPLLDSGNPETLRSLIAVVRREQYEVPGLWPRRAPLWLQIGNFGQWADWQVAFGLHPHATAAWPRTLLTLAWVWLGALGLRAIWHRERRVGRAVLLLLVSASLGVVVWLNLRVGPSFGHGVVAADAVHEARERDYFFALAFWTWGLLAGAGTASLATALMRRLPMPLAVLPFSLALVPLLGNREVADRSREPVATLPRTYARMLLDAVPQRGVLLAAGDNDTFPLWYLQQVEDYRSDVTVVTVPLLGAAWYREDLAAAGLLDSTRVARWTGLPDLLQSVMRHSEDARRSVRVSTLLTATDRKKAAPGSGWLLEGLVYAPSTAVSPGQVGLDRTVLGRRQAEMPRSALTPLPPGSDPAAHMTQELLRCLQVTELTDTLLVSGCNGA
ncbi:MAG: DUF2723 domain-containing protein [Gemmatimonadaceae bacterium]|nr:DUF2723 domain-containing protein [Gemmatimonadaceae bacterium]